MFSLQLLQYNIFRHPAIQETLVTAEKRNETIDVNIRKLSYQLYPSGYWIKRVPPHTKLTLILNRKVFKYPTVAFFTIEQDQKIYRCDKGV